MAEDLPDRIVRPTEARRVFGVSRATLWRMQKRGDIPAPLRISRGAVGWRASTIADILDQWQREAEGASDDAGT